MNGEKPSRPWGPEGTTWLGLLSPEDVVPWKSPRDLYDMVEECADTGNVERLFVAGNRLALSLYRTGEITAATRLCHHQIHVVAHQPIGERTAEHIALALQPVVNLIRMQGYAQDLVEALYQLRLLEGLADGNPVELFGLSVDPKTYPGSAGELRALRAFAKNNCLVETSKILFRRGTRQAWLEACIRLGLKWPATLHTGPFHAFEAWSVGGVHWAGEAVVASVLTSIDALHRTAGAEPSAVRATAASWIFESRSHAGFTTDLGQARFLAVLGVALADCGEPASGEICLGEAYQLACRVDPGLANAIAARWRLAVPDSSRLPDAVAVPVPARDELIRLADRVSERLGAYFRAPATVVSS